MNLLREWQAKPSFQHTFPCMPAYYSPQSGKMDLDLREICRHEDALTLDLDSRTGFREVDILPVTYDRQKIYYKGPWERTMKFSKLRDVALRYFSIYKKYFEKLWDPKVFHVIFSSGGRDSRIIANVLWDMQQKGFDLGEFVFLCHQPEQELFKRGMAEIGWDDEHLVIYKEDECEDKKDDYYEWSFDHNMNSFQGPPIRFHQKYDTSKSCLVTGSFMPNFGDVNQTHQFYLQIYPLEHLSEDYFHWKDILIPALGYDFIKMVFDIPARFYIPVMGDKDDHRGLASDIVRNSVLQLMGTTVPCHFRRDYNFNLSKQQITRLNEDYLQSKFFNQFGAITPNELPGATIWDKNKLSSKLFGLATMYEGI